MKRAGNIGPAVLIFAVACNAEIGAPNGGTIGSGGAGNGNGTGGGGTNGGGNGSGGNGSVQPAPERVWQTPAFSRLTHTQWQNTVVDVFGLTESEAADLAAGFRTDPAGSGYLFENHTEALAVDETLWTAYRRAADDAAALLFGDSTRRDAFVSRYGGTNADAAEPFVRNLGERAHRRPLDDTQVTAYLDVYTAGRDLFPDLNDPHLAGLRLVTQAILQSPYFVYRVELGTDGAATENPLTDHEIATRLAYFLWNTAPDAALLTAADSGELTTAAGLEAQAQRMLADPRAEGVVAEYHRQLLDVGRYDRIGPSPVFFPDVSGRLPELARQETDLFVRMIWSEEGGLTDLMTSRETFVNDELAGIYGLEGSFGDEMTRVELDAATRKGVFTQVGFLASHATAVDPDPIHRGIFLSERMACNRIGVPPGEIPPLPAPNGRTNREVVEDHTEQPGTDCLACHQSLINPFGFAFESYDAVGGFRTMDGDYPVDTTAEPLIGGDIVPVSGALELIDVMAASEAVHACYAKHWLELAFGVKAESGRDGLVERLRDDSLDGASVRELLMTIVTSEPFRTRQGGVEG
jgi:hypothetical protein